jgi:hypothetical protein
MDKDDFENIAETVSMIRRLADRIERGEMGNSVGVASVVFSDGAYSVWSFGVCENAAHANLMFDIGKLKLVNLSIEDDPNGDSVGYEKEDRPANFVAH